MSTADTEGADDGESADESDPETVRVEWQGTDSDVNDYEGKLPESHIFYDRERRKQYNPGVYALDPDVAAEYVAWRPSLPDSEGWRYVESEDTEDAETGAVEEVAERIVAGDLDHVRSELSWHEERGALTDDLLDAVLNAETERASHPEEHTDARKGVGEAVESYRSE